MHLWIYALLIGISATTARPPAGHEAMWASDFTTADAVITFAAASLLHYVVLRFGYSMQSAAAACFSVPIGAAWAAGDFAFHGSGMVGRMTWLLLFVAVPVTIVRVARLARPGSSSIGALATIVGVFIAGLGIPIALLVVLSWFIKD